MNETGSTDQFVNWEMRSVWNDAADFPKKVSESDGQNWDRSALVWIRVAEENNREPYTAIGRCMYPKKPIEFIPVGPWENSAVKIKWGDDEPFYDVNGHRVKATHWLACPEPVPPGEVMPIVITGTECVNSFSQFRA